jgi:hypothetical protein
MDFPKFWDLFTNEELYLRRVDLFKEDDPWEALPSDQPAVGPRRAEHEVERERPPLSR